MSFINCAELPDHIEQLCNDFRKGGFPSLAFVERTHTITDWEDAAQWATNVASGKVRIINRIKAQLPEPSEVESDNPVGCGADTILDGFDWEITWEDANVNAYNDDFYKNLNLKVGYFVMFNCEAEEIRVVEKNVTFAAKPKYPPSVKERQVYMAKAKWTSKANEFPVLYNAPANTFDTE